MPHKAVKVQPFPDLDISDRYLAHAWVNDPMWDSKPFPGWLGSRLRQGGVSVAKETLKRSHVQLPCYGSHVFFCEWPEHWFAVRKDRGTGKRYLVSPKSLVSDLLIPSHFPVLGYKISLCFYLSWNGEGLREEQQGGVVAWKEVVGERLEGRRICVL